MLDKQRLGSYPCLGQWGSVQAKNIHTLPLINFFCGLPMTLSLAAASSAAQPNPHQATEPQNANARCCWYCRAPKVSSYSLQCLSSMARAFFTLPHAI